MSHTQAKEIAVHWPLINRIAGRRFADAALAEEAALYVLNRLEENNCKRLKAFSGRSKLSTFISSVTVRLLEDFSRQKFGRARPPAWISELGGIWITLFQLLCMQRLNLIEAIETMKNRVAALKKDQIEKTALTILERVINCGQHQGLEISLSDTDERRLQKQDNSGRLPSDPEENLLQLEQRTVFALLFEETASTDQDKAPSTAEQSFTSLLKTPVQLTASERLLLKLCFQDDLSVTKAGLMLGLNTNQVHGKLRRLLARLRDDFDRAGISDELRIMLAAD